MAKSPLILSNYQAPGDILMMTAAIRDLHRCYPGRYQTAIKSSCPDIWLNNPYLSTEVNNSARELVLNYPLIHSSNFNQLHFLNGFINDLNNKLHLQVELTEFKADLHFSDWELANPMVAEDYWIIVTGIKPDFPAKAWSFIKWQRVVDAFKGKIQFVQVGAKQHLHPALKGVTNYVGKTPRFRDLMRLVLHCQGVCTIVSNFMHLAAACNKPCVVVAGGREPYTWEAYDEYTRKLNMPDFTKERICGEDFIPHVYLHSLGLLECCKTKACWKSKLGQGLPHENCCDIVASPGQLREARCMEIIQEDHVIEAIEKYLSEKDNVQAKPKSRHRPSLIRKKIMPQKAITIKKDYQPGLAWQGPVVEPPAALDSALYCFQQLPITIYLMLFDHAGKYSHLHIRLLSTLYRCTSSDGFRLRVVMKNCLKTTHRLVDEIDRAHGNIERIYVYDEKEISKEEIRQQVCSDRINTKWLLWVEDDSYFHQADWLSKLLDRMERHSASCFKEKRSPYKYFVGKQQRQLISADQVADIVNSDWYNGVSVAKNKQGFYCSYVHNAFMVYSVEMINALERFNWRDGLQKYHCAIEGEYLRQQGYQLVDYHYGVAVNQHPSRMLSEEYV